MEAIDEDADGDEAAVGLAANTLLSDTTASFSLSESDARAVQDDVDGLIEREVVKLRNAATRVKDDDTPRRENARDPRGRTRRLQKGVRFRA